MLKILVADDHAIVRRGLKDIILDEFPGADISECSTGQAVIDTIDSQLWNILILDISFPDKHGLEVLKELKNKTRTPPVIVLSLYSEEQYAARVFKAGGCGYLTKESAPEELVIAIKKVLGGRKYVSPSFAEQLADQIGKDPGSVLIIRLSDREIQVLTLIGQGKTVSKIADSLSLSVKTVSTYRSRLLEKLYLHTTADLIRFAIDESLVP